MAGQVHSSGSKSWQPPRPYSWGLSIPHDISRLALKEQTIIKTVKTIHALVRQQKPNLHGCLPVLGQEVRNLLEDYSHGIEILSINLGHDHHQVKQLMEKRDHLAGEAKGVRWLLYSILNSLEEAATPNPNQNLCHSAHCSQSDNI
jgi:hypothetical protein